MLELAAEEIAKLAFSSVIQAGTGALSIEAAKKLWHKMRSKFHGNPSAEKALNDAEQTRSWRSDSNGTENNAERIIIINKFMALA